MQRVGSGSAVDLSGLEIYQVGGSVRDRLLGLPAGDRDFVVVGSSPEELRRRGLRPVGRDFPVFLHPETGEEYALARTERKQGRGYHGFVFHTGPEVSLAEDLARRDLTINAMALSAQGELIDPCNGQKDLQQGILRHVSEAFREDPVRVLRLARFATRFGHFRIAAHTLKLCRDMVANGEVEHLVPERVWQEFSRALMHDQPARFISVLHEMGALPVVLPELAALFGVPQSAARHPDSDAGRHALLVLDRAAELGGDLSVRFAALVHDLGKAGTASAAGPAPPGEESLGLRLIGNLCQRLRVPAPCRDLALLVAECHRQVQQVNALEAAAVVRLLERLDLFRRPQRLTPFLLACQAADGGLMGRPDRSYPQGERLRRAYAVAAAVEAGPLMQRGLSGAELGQALHATRVEQVALLWV